MRVLVTGATGFIGSHLVEKLLEQGYQLRCSVRKSSNLQWLKNLPIEFTFCDLINNIDIHQSVKDVDFIYHVAGLTKARTKEEYFRGNHIATKNLLIAAREVNPGLKRFVHISSGAAVGPGSADCIVTEDTPFHPITTYGISKMEAEKECRKLMTELPITIVRPPAVYGPRDKDIFEFFNTMNKGLQPMVGFTDKFVSLIHIHDLVRGTILAGEHPSAIGKTYFISSEKYYDWKEVGKVTARVMKKKALRLRIPEAGIYLIAAFSEIVSLINRKPALINFEKARDMVQSHWTFDITRAKTELGFREEYSLEEGIKNTVDWYRNQGWLA
ncbi:MAG: NAD-dependent epimerase/dehydratase family protein [Bacteroidota bacterium]